MIINKYVKNSHFREVLSGSFIALVYRVLGVLLGFILMWIISYYFSSERVGLYMLSWSILTVLVMFTGILGAIAVITLIMILTKTKIVDRLTARR